jgi:YidC/Oxa1 family membrane protein insertase
VFSGVAFPIGVLIYWTTTNIWSMGQQFYTIRRMPAPGSPAEKALEARRLKKGKEHKKFTLPGLSHGSEADDVLDSPAEPQPQSGQRQQPKRKNRAKPAGQGDGSPGPTPPGAKPAGAKPPGAKPPGAKPPGAKPSGAKPPATADGDA